MDLGEIGWGLLTGLVTKNKYVRYIISLTRYVTETVRFEACKYPCWSMCYISLPVQIDPWALDSKDSGLVLRRCLVQISSGTPPIMFFFLPFIFVFFILLSFFAPYSLQANFRILLQFVTVTSVEHMVAQPLCLKYGYKMR
jgi:hypothetical protein